MGLRKLSAGLRETMVGKENEKKKKRKIIFN
jgi:hypothetical protein